MGKLLFWIAVAIIIYVIWTLVRISRRREERERAAGNGSRRADSARGDGDRPQIETMVQCAACDVHLPASEAVYSRGRAYCGPAHRDLDERRSAARAAADVPPDGADRNR
ncbi:MAG TPA: PP0621 family protein [Burkholderiaceae bacterium]|nr:PP0621 family protein [Burkholderiaceae bacterium]